MRAVFIVFSLVFISTESSAQNELLTAGGDASSSAGSFSFSLGQVSYESLENTTYKVYQGVQQPYLASATNKIQTTIDNLPIVVFPNPVDDYVFIQNDDQNLSYRIADAGGKVLGTGILGKEKTALDMRYYSTGVYFFIIQNKQNNQKTYTLIKK